MQSKLALPVGVSDFRKVRESNRFYVDKTSIIDELLDAGAKVTLITRPRCFGKTLVMTMIRDFFDITQESKEIFNGLSIMSSRYASKINSTPVIHMSFKDCEGSIENVMTCIYSALLEVVQKSYFIKSELDFIDNDKYDKIVKKLMNNEFDLRHSIGNTIYFLSKIYHQYYGKRVIILIDEYDTPMLSAYEQGYEKEIEGFLDTLYSSALKDNSHLQFGVMIGTHRVLFSGLNNLYFCGTKDDTHKADFGLTEQETNMVLDCFDLELTDDVRKMYGGYNFAGVQIYNPRSVINYAKKRELVPYRVNATSSGLLVQAILVADKSVKEDLEQLLSGSQVRVSKDLQISFLEVDRPATLWELLLNIGYLTVTHKPEANASQIEVRIPNNEVMTSFHKLVERSTNLAGKPLL